MRPWEERRAVERETWKLWGNQRLPTIPCPRAGARGTYRLARWAVKWVSDCKWAGRDGSEAWECEGALPPVWWAMLAKSSDCPFVRSKILPKMGHCDIWTAWATLASSKELEVCRRLPGGQALLGANGRMVRVSWDNKRVESSGGEIRDPKRQRPNESRRGSVAMLKR